MFERFSQEARAAVVGAKQEAIRAGQRDIATDHLLVALAAGSGVAAQALAAAGVTAADLRGRLVRDTDAEPDPLDADALASIGIDLDAVRRASDAAFGPGALDRAGARRAGRGLLTGSPRMTKLAKQSLELALRAALRQGDRSISSGHLLLGLLDQDTSPAIRTLAAAGADPVALREDTIRRMRAAA
jgi:ATP-dependent Clp protease ATP-binding subunit ClpA